MEGGEERQEEVEVAVAGVGRRRHSLSTPPSMCGEGRPSVTSNGPGRGRDRRQMQRSRAWEKKTRRGAFTDGGRFWRSFYFFFNFSKPQTARFKWEMTTDVY